MISHPSYRISILFAFSVSSFCLTGCSPFGTESAGSSKKAHSRAQESASSTNDEPTKELQHAGDRPEQFPVASGVTPFDQSVLNETNLVRAQPKAYVEKLRSWRSRFQADGMTVLKEDGRLLRTKEGVAAVDEAIRFLNTAEPVGSLSLSPGLSLAAQDHVTAQGATGATGHNGTNGDMKQRIERHGAWETAIAENIHYGGGNAADAVMKLIIDDGVSNRGHRNTLFNPALQVMGIASGNHAVFQRMCVMIYTGGFTSKR